MRGTSTVLSPHVPRDIPTHPDLTQIRSIAPVVEFLFSWAPLLVTRATNPSKAPEHPDVEVAQVRVGASGIRTLIMRPKNKSITDPLPTVVWIHGGGLIFGTPEASAHSTVRLVTDLGLQVVLPQYRLAPENTSPAASDDVFEVLQWASTGGDGRVDTSRVSVGGNSAGGGLAATLAQRAFDAGIVLRSQLLVYPMLDDRSNLPGAVHPPHPAVWTRYLNTYGWRSYLGKHADAPEGAPKYTVAARREGLEGLAEAWIGVGLQDLFYEEDVTYARRLREAGVKCDIVEVPGAPHAFDEFCKDAPVVKEFVESQLAFFKRTLA
ncbi:alpha/beta hydrolase domain-containing protein [Gonapodya prolifera JEL478]|uniref:Alpha/beta hydrolase domain-containing protein n=1 Tax=Gonapodya prolifera (strain JEL478) TaxID=1344416 RepID=A0A139AW82_GONPJ|nr:alpha/beta hydrolase domain-containing protein [Gonapodya prolifera JEL478]|eukprot:KXS20843.1 alpha/beta hydrolase domain-containing protein [Gonapodya prolifera JEL478]